MNEFEFKLLEAIQVLKCGFMDYVLPKISSLGDAGIIWIIISIGLISFKKTRKCGFTVGLSLLLCLVLNNLALKNIVARPRPFQVDETIKLIISPPREFSFPSGHTLSSFAASTSICYYYRKYGVAAFILALIISFTRLYLRVHFPTDILGGIAFGIAFGFLSIFIVKFLCNKVKSKKETE